MASIGHAVEYMLSLERPSGGRLAYSNVIQIRVPQFPASTTLNYNTAPAVGEFMMIFYGFKFSPRTVPDVFTAWIQQYGNKFVDFTVSASVVGEQISGFVPATHGQPVLSGVTNTSNLVQYWETISEQIIIQTKEDYDIILDELRHRNTSALSEGLSKEIRDLLYVLTTRDIMPYSSERIAGRR